MNADRTAIIIPLYNGGPWIEQTLRSVQAQTRPPIQIIVVDDGSTDDSVEKASRFPGVTVFRNPEKGANAAREFGLRQTDATFVAMLDQDDLWHPQHLEHLENLAQAHLDAPAVFAGVVRFDHGSLPTLSGDGTTCMAFDPWHAFPAAAIPTPSQVLIRRTALASAGGWTRRFIGLADYHAWLRLSAQHPFWHHPSPTVGYRQHPTSHSASLRRDQQNAFLLRLFAAAEDVLPGRARCFPENAAVLGQRVRIARAMLAWLVALEDSDPAGQAISAKELNRQMLGQPNHVLESLWGQLFYLRSESQAHASASSKARRILHTYWRAPFATVRVRRSLRQLVFRRARETIVRSLRR
jgi:glycosyltransferase involved in cell wall biosynthesis